MDCLDGRLVKKRVNSHTPARRIKMELMDLTFNEQQQIMLTGARDFVEKECPTSLVREMETSEDGYSRELWMKMAQLGWTGIMFPEKYGGMGGNSVDAMILYEAMGRALLPSPHLPTVTLCGLTISSIGSEEQKSDLLPRIAKGEVIMALAMLEPPDVSYDPSSILLQAVPEGDEYIISGTKLFVTYAHVADWLLCIARTRQGKAAQGGITVFLVDAKASGISYSPMPVISGEKQYEVVFDKVRVAKRNIVGKLHQGWSSLHRVLLQATVLQCAEIVGACSKVHEMAIQHAKDRVQFGDPIGVNQGIQFKCADMGVRITFSRLLTHVAAAALTDGELGLREVAAAKTYTSDTASFVAYEGHQVFSGIGYVQEHDMQLFSRRLRAWQYSLGDASYHRELYAQAIEL